VQADRLTDHALDIDLAFGTSTQLHTCDARQVVVGRGVHPVKQSNVRCVFTINRDKRAGDVLRMNGDATHDFGCNSGAMAAAS
jgi:ribosomal protein L11 methylase PrmA